MELTTAWFVAIAFLWTGYFVLEGFDFGVGVLLPNLGRTPPQRQALLGTIGPVWDGNEVWLITAIGATFAAFPHWYATLLSGFYLPLLAIIVALIVRGVGLEYRGKRDDARWKARCDLAITAGSAIPAVTWGVIFANFNRGVPIDADMEYAGTLGDLLNPYALLGGAVTLVLFATHGATFLALKTATGLRDRAHDTARRLTATSIIVTAVYVLWTVTIRVTTISAVLAAFTVAALAASLIATRLHKDGWAFTGTTCAIAALTAATFTAIHPAVLPSTLNPDWSLTVHNAASSPYTLTIMTWAAAICLPVVIGYQTWTYWVFRRRVTAD
ncbi:MAG: cytochrome d ubiquinol oxidase subunit II [Longispora sp.]|nr:cytochrome d ubiquinol oxidase subunit II [Longispora sp. (in: high G+C Gram-positive bacteria)]